jgi:uncharacterized membrane protein
MNRYVTVGLSVLAGAALLEATLIPGIVIGGAAVLAPTVLPKLLRRSQRPSSGNRRRRRIERTAPLPVRLLATAQPGVLRRLGITRAIAKTITFRIIVTALDFTTNYLVIGEFATAAGLSAFTLAAGPVFYFVHETAWNYYGPSRTTAIDLSVILPGRRASKTGRSGFAISRAVAKTITFRTVATVVDFTVTYIVVGDLATAALLSAFGFVFGPFVYLGHEMAWDYYGAPGKRLLALPAPESLAPAPESLAPAPVV